MEDEFKFSVAKYLLRLETMKKLTADVINLVIENTVDLICRRLAVHNIKENDIEMITKTVGSDYMRYKYYKSHCGFVQPEEVILGQWWVAYKGRYKQVNGTCYCVPFLDSLKSIFQLPEMTDFILHRMEHNDGIIQNCTQADYYKNDRFFSGLQIWMGVSEYSIIFNIGDVCLVNPLGVRATKHKFTIAYFTIGDIPH